jgi:hypothetical protein
MSIINNRGIFNLGTAYLRQLGNDWPTAQVFFTSDITEVNSNLYYTNARVLSALTGNVTVGNIIATIHQGNIWVGLYTANVIESASNLYYTNARVNSNVIAFLPSLAGSGIAIQANGQISANAAATATFATTANVANTVLALTGLTTTSLSEGNNLYYTNTRARTAFIAGKGIRIFSDGTIKSIAAGGEYNQSLDGGVGYTVSNVMAGITFTGVTSNDRYILRSMQVTNISNNTAYVSSNVKYSTNATGYLGNLIAVPQGGFVEFMGRTQIFQPGDSIYFQGFDNNQVPASNILSAYLTYESVSNDVSYVGAGQTMANANSNVSLVIADTADFVIESVKFVNLKQNNIPVTLYIANTTTTVPKAYLAFNMIVPGVSSLEVLQSQKLLKYGDSLYASYANSSNADSIAVFTSYRKTDATSLATTTPSVASTGTVGVVFNTTLAEGTTLYYTVE